MPDFLNAALKRFSTFPANTDPATARALLILRAGMPGGTFVHASWVPIFFHLDLTVLAWWNIGAALLFATASVLAHYPGRWLNLAFLFCIIEMPLHGILATYYMGSETAFWIWPVTASTFVFGMVSFSWAKRIALSVLIVLMTIIMVTLLAFADTKVDLPQGWQAFFVASNLLGGMAQLALLFALFQNAVETAERRLTVEFDRAEGLLRNILPDAIALRLKDGEQLIADEHEEVSVIFADIVNFTESSARLSAADLVDTLNRVFIAFDQLAAKHGAEKIKTIGDSYMAVVGVPDARQDHAGIAVDLALDMLTEARRISAETHFPIDLRIGINTGPVVAGVIGSQKFAYDLWGDAVNVAARMEAHSDAGKVLITAATQTALRGRYSTRQDGTRDVKGKGVMPVYEVEAAT